MMNNTAKNLELTSTTVTATVEHYTYQNRDNDFCIVRLQNQEKGTQLTGVGHLSDVPVGSSVRLVGEWTTHRKYGQQFKFERYQLLQPNTLIGIERYLGSGLIKGIGPNLAAHIVKAFGLKTIDIIDNEPHRLTEIHGLGEKRIDKIKTAWAEQKDIQEIMIFLQGEGISSAYAVKIYKRYGKDSIAKVKKNPYQLAEDIWGISFIIADKIAESVGVQKNSPLRIKSGILHTLSEASKSGHCYLPEKELFDNAEKILELPQEVITNNLPSLVESQKIVAKDEKIALAALYHAEVGILSKLTNLKAGPPTFSVVKEDSLILQAETQMEISFAASQVKAIKSVLRNKINILTGGPGTGKTTILKAVLQLLEGSGSRVALAAPTGRAAKKLSEVTGQDAKTIHRLLEYAPATRDFQRKEDNPLDVDLLVVDESSMLDVFLCNNLLKAVPPEASLLLVGDVDQLPSVGPGNVLKDIIASKLIPVVKLSRIFRQGHGSLISVNAHNINNGNRLTLEQGYEGKKDFYCIYKEEQEDILSVLIKLCSKHIEEQFGFNRIKDIQVLAPMRRGIIGIQNLNSVLQENLNPFGTTLSWGSKMLRVADKVMQIRNNYKKEIFNGDIGFISNINTVEQVLTVNFEGKHVEYDFGSELDELTLSYASTIHKSQGSEYPCVVIPIHTSHYMMLQRNLLYTAVTRGRKMVILVGSKKAIAIAIRNNNPVNRYTWLEQVNALTSSEESCF